MSRDERQPVYDVIVIGAGVAGLCAALTAATRNASVLLLDKESQIGGNSRRATSGINMCNTPIQADSNNGVSADSRHLLLQDTVRSAQGAEKDAQWSQANELQQTLAEGTVDARATLEMCGIRWASVVRCGGHSCARTHRPVYGRHKPVEEARNAGAELVAALHDACLRFSVSIRCGCAVVALVQDASGGVAGVRCADSGTMIQARRGVVLATGGFAANASMLQSVLGISWAADIGTSNGPSAQGEGIALGCSVGAAVRDMNLVQLHPTAFVAAAQRNGNTRHHILAPEALRGYGGLLLRESDGSCCCDALATRQVIAEALLNESQRRCVLCIPLDAAQQFGLHQMQFYVEKQAVQEYADWQMLCDAMGWSYEATAGLWPLSARSKRFYAGLVTPVSHYCMGGLCIDRNTRVLRADGSHVKRLFACGEVTGGVHGHNRLAGNSLLECVVFGLRAGRSVLAQ